MKTNLSTLSLSAMMLAGASSSALAIDFNDKFYGKGEVNIGYSARFYSGDVKDAIDGAKSEGESYNSAAHSLAVGTGFNVFYKATDKIHPFVGLGVEGKYAFKNEFVKDNKFQNFLNVNAKLGSAFKVNKDLTVRPYALVGMSVNQYKTKEVEASGVEEDEAFAARAFSLPGGDVIFPENMLDGSASNTVSGRYYGENNFSNDEAKLAAYARSLNFASLWGAASVIGLTKPLDANMFGANYEGDNFSRLIPDTADSKLYITSDVSSSMYYRRVLGTEKGNYGTLNASTIFAGSNDMYVYNKDGVENPTTSLINGQTIRYVTKQDLLNMSEDKVEGGISNEHLDDLDKGNTEAANDLKQAFREYVNLDRGLTKLGARKGATGGYKLQTGEGLPVFNMDTVVSADGEHAYVFVKKVGEGDSISLSNPTDYNEISYSGSYDLQNKRENSHVISDADYKSRGITGSTEEEKFTKYMQQELGDDFSPLFLTCVQGEGCSYYDYRNYISQADAEKASGMSDFLGDYLSNVVPEIDDILRAMKESKQNGNAYSGATVPTRTLGDDDPFVILNHNHKDQHFFSYGSKIYDAYTGKLNAGLTEEYQKLLGRGTNNVIDGVDADKIVESAPDGRNGGDNDDIVARSSSKTSYNVGANVGAGVEFVIKDRYTAGIEYRYTDVKVNGVKFKTHDVGVKFGVQFL